MTWVAAEGYERKTARLSGDPEAAILARTERWAEAVTADLRRVLARQRRATLERLTSAKTRKDTAFWEPAGIKALDVESAFGAQRWIAEVEREVAPTLASIWEDVTGAPAPADPESPVGEIAAVIGAYWLWRRFDEWQGRWLAITSGIVADVLDTIRKAIVSAAGAVGGATGAVALRTVIDEAYDRAEAVTVGRIGEQVGVGATNEAILFEALDSGMALQKTWVSRRDASVRPSHNDVHERSEIEPVALEEAFELHSKYGVAYMQFPGDPTGPIWELANCRCSLGLVPAVEPGKVLDVGGLREMKDYLHGALQ